MKKGFTLIELLVVIAIIAVLMGILMPALSRVKRQAQNMTCRAHLKQWGLIYKFYTDENDNKFPYGQDNANRDLWLTALRPYYKDEWKMLLCPTAKGLAYNENDWGTFKSYSMTTNDTEFISSYGSNNWVDNMSAARGARPEEWFWKSTARAIGPTSNIPVLADSTWHDGWPRDNDTPPPEPDQFRSGNKGTTDEMRHYCIDRHDGVTNLVFMDWSVRGVGLKELWTLKWHRNFDIAGPWTQPDTQWPIWLRKY